VQKEIFKNKVLMITGGTGSFGNTVLNSFLRTEPSIRKMQISYSFILEM